MSERPTPPRPTRLAWLRLVLALAAVGIAFALYLYSARACPRSLLRDPATLLYPLMLVGLALRLFWARYLVLCFCTGIFGMSLAAGQLHALSLLGLASLAALLAGPGMRALFEGRPTRLNLWAAPARTTGRLKLAMLGQSLALGVLWPTVLLHPLRAYPLHALALGLALVGVLALIAQRGWSLFPLLAACAVEAVLALRLGLSPHLLEGPLDGMRTAGILAAATVVSAVVLLPALVRAWRALAAS